MIAEGYPGFFRFSELNKVDPEFLDWWFHKACKKKMLEKYEKYQQLIIQNVREYGEKPIRNELKRIDFQLQLMELGKCNYEKYFLFV